LLWLGCDSGGSDHNFHQPTLGLRQRFGVAEANEHLREREAESESAAELSPDLRHFDGLIEGTGKISPVANRANAESSGGIQTAKNEM